MREIKFRAWDKKEKIMSQIDDFTGLNYSDEYEYKYVCAHRIIQWTDLEVMQFTGLLDKNGKEIYEGDIVESLDGNKSEIVFDRGCFVLQHEPRIRRSFDFIAEKNYFEIIGNIYENTELIK